MKKLVKKYFLRNLNLKHNTIFFPLQLHVSVVAGKDIR